MIYSIVHFLYVASCIFNILLLLHESILLSRSCLVFAVSRTPFRSRCQVPPTTLGAIGDTYGCVVLKTGESCRPKTDVTLDSAPWVFVPTWWYQLWYHISLWSPCFMCRTRFSCNHLGNYQSRFNQTRSQCFPTHASCHVVFSSRERFDSVLEVKTLT